jgi:hypothetical protein
LTSDDDFIGLGTTAGLDLSDEGLEARGWVGSDHSPDALPDDAETEGDAPTEPEAAPTEDVEPEAEAEASTDEFELPEKLQGKDAAALAKMYLELEKLHGSQANEYGDIKSLVEKQQEQLELMRDAMANQQSTAMADDLVELVRANPTGIYQQAIEALDHGHIGIDTVEEIIDEVEAQADELADEGDTESARQYRKLARIMQRDFDRRITLAESRAAQQPLQQAAVQQAYEKGVGGYFNLPDADDAADARAYQQDVQNLVKGKNLGSTPEQVTESLRRALYYVRGMNPTRSAAFIRQQEALKAGAVAEQGSAEPPPANLTEADRIREGIFAVNKPKDPFDFASIGAKR